jgi:AraC family ethanolamine operon transcriptional activator
MAKEAGMSARIEELYCTDDVDLLSKRYYAAPIDYVQTSPGKLGAAIHAVATPKVEIREAHFQSAVLNVIERPLPRFGIALGMEGQSQLFGTQFTNSNLGYITGRNGVFARISTGSGWCNITIDDALLQEVAAVHGYVIPTEDDSYGLPTRQRAGLVRRLSRIARSQEGSTLSDEQFEDAMALLILRALNPSYKNPREKNDKRWAVAHQVIDYIHANYTRPMTLTGLCQLAGVSERTLRYSFVEATGLSLQQYLTHYRLHRAHALLMESKVAEVGEAAAACGIPHAGRFSQYFKALFGESPSQVLRRPAQPYRGQRNH